MFLIINVLINFNFDKFIIIIIIIIIWFEITRKDDLF